MTNLSNEMKPLQNLHLDFETLYALFSHLKNENSHLSIKVKGQIEEVEAIWYEVPGSFEDSPDDLKVLKENKFEDYYEFLNEIFDSVNLSTVDVAEAKEKGWQFDYMQINFYTLPVEKHEKMFKIIKCSFYFLFIIENDAEELNAFRSFYRRGNDYTINNFLQAKDFININQPDEADKFYVEQLEKNIVGLAQYAGTKINDNLRKKYPDSLLQENATVKDFERIITLVNYNSTVEDIEQTAQSLFAGYQKNLKELAEEQYSYLPQRYEIINADTNFWDSDWKFNPEDIEWFIKNTLGEDWTFEYPADTYSHDLFPYIQKELEKDGLALMNIDTLGDSYYFFLVKKQDVDEILNLSNKLKLGIEKIQ